MSGILLYFWYIVKNLFLLKKIYFNEFSIDDFLLKFLLKSQKVRVRRFTP